MISSIIPRNILPASGESSAAVTVTGPASVGVKGGYVQLIGSTARRTLGITIAVDLSIVADTVIDIGVGGVGVEVTVIFDLPCFASGGSSKTYFVFFVPIVIPAGSRIAARLANTENGTAQSMNTRISLHQE